MPQRKTWLPRYPLILERLRASPAGIIFQRPDVEQLFAVGTTVAKELMGAAGCVVQPGPGTPAQVTREALLSYLLNSTDGRAAFAEVERRKRLAETLHKANQEAKLRTIRLPLTEADEWAGFQDLPNLTLAHGVLTVVFSDPLDLMAQLYRFAKAVGAEWGGFLLKYEEKIQEGQKKAS